jgi:hypothetical protein
LVANKLGRLKLLSDGTAFTILQVAENTSFQDFWKNNGPYIILITTSLIVILAFGLLLGRKESKRSLVATLILIIVASILTTTFSPVSKEWNTLIIAAFLTPIFAYLVDFLRDKQKFSSEKDKLSWEYRCQQVERESNIIGELLGELSTHAAAFKSSDAQEIESKRWKNSFKSGLISDIHTLSVARYYHHIPMYNNIVANYARLLEHKDVNELKDLSASLQELKGIFLEAESAIYLTLVYDLGMLQQNYLARPTVEFPVHMNLMLRRLLEKYKIIEKESKIDPAKIFSPLSSERFNKETVIHLNVCYAKIGISLKSMIKKMEVLKEKSVEAKGEAKTAAVA